MRRISIIVPVYNGEKYIKRSLDSLLLQTLDNLEVIVVLNGCTDNTKKIVESYTNNVSKLSDLELKKQDVEVKMFELSKPSIGEARNLGIKNSSGKYILFFDSDDSMNSKMCEELYNYAEENNLDIVNSDYYTLNEETGAKKYISTYDFTISSLKSDSDIFYKINYGPVKLFKRDLIERYKIKFPTDLKYEDIPFVAKALLNSERIGTVKKPLYNYTIRTGSQQMTVDFKVFDLFDSLNIVNELAKEFNFLPREVLVSLNVYNITTFMLKQKYQKDKRIKKQFIDEAFKYLNNLEPNWRKSKFIKEQSFMKKVVKTNKFLIKLFCLV